MTKQKLLDDGRDLAAEFCEVNCLVMPEVHVSERNEWRFSHTCAYYRPVVINICPAACAHIGTGGRAWSYPGYAIDRTPYGVIQHELGHHVDYTMSQAKLAYSGDYGQRMRQLSGEPKLTGYCPDDAEWFAEHFRLFITNSDLLRLLRPRLYSYLRQSFQPVIDLPWAVVLKDAPERTQLQAAKKIERIAA